MPQISNEFNIAMGTAAAASLSFDGGAFNWDTNAPTPALIGRNITGDHIQWLTESTLVFESSQSGTRRLYTYNIRTGACSQVSASGADVLYAGGGIWAKSLSGTGYVDSLGRTHASYGVAGVDADGTVLIILNNADTTGLGYLRPTMTSATDHTVICYDVLERTVPASIRSNCVMFHSGGVLRQYLINSDTMTSSNVPVALYQNDGEWIVGTHTLGLGQVVFNIEDRMGWSLGPTTTNYYPDIRLAPSRQIINIAASVTDREQPQEIKPYRFTLPSMAPQVDLYTNILVGRPLISPTTTPTDYGATVIGSDVVSFREDRSVRITSLSSQFNNAQTVFSLLSGNTAVYPNTAQNLLVSLNGVIQEPDVAYSVNASTITFASAPATASPFFATVLSDAVRANSAIQREFGYAILSSDWFGSTGGQHIRGAWQYGVTAVVAATDATGNTNVTVKDSDNQTYVAGEAAYGNTSVIIRRDPTSSASSLLWEVTWIQNANTYARIILDDTLTPTGNATTNSSFTFGDLGLVDIDSDTDDPIPAADVVSDWYGYVRLKYPTTRGDWTVGIDVSPTCPVGIQRLVAWNSRTTRAYVVWNADPQYGDITLPPRLTLEYNASAETTGVVIPAKRSTLIRQHQWRPLSQSDLLQGILSGTQ